MDIGVKIKDLLDKKNKSVKELAIHLGVSHQNIYAYTNGRANPPIDKLEMIASFFEINANDLIKKENPFASDSISQMAIYESLIVSKNETIRDLRVENERLIKEMDYIKNKFDKSEEKNERLLVK